MQGRSPLALLITSCFLLSLGSARAQHSVARQWNEELLDAIRIDTPHPPKHARNLFHTAVAMYDAWAAYDATAIGYIHHERATAPGSIETAREEAISFAAYRVLKSRFASGPGAATSNAAFDALMGTLGYNISTTSAIGTAPANVGNRIAATILAWGLADGSNESGSYNDPAYFNPQPPMIVLDEGHAVGGIPAGTDPNRWQPLSLDAAFSQNGIPIPTQVQPYLGVTWLATLPFAHSRSNPALPWIDPGPVFQLSVPGIPSPSDAVYKSAALEVLRKGSKLNSTELINISPKATGNNPLGTDDGAGHAVNPVTGLPYADNFVKLGDWARVMAEFWADGPQSETPPGHWHVLANEASDDPALVKKIGGAGPTVNDLEWDVKVYFSLSAATHDAACACWGAKRFYEGPRPITMIRYLCNNGQCSDPGLPSYTAQGIPLETDVCEVITAASSAAGQKHEQIWDMSTRAYVPGSSHIGKIAVFAWPSEPDDRVNDTMPVRWMFGKDWVPFQRENFNTPAFPGYISGHSTFSRSAAEVLSAITGSPFVPGGLGTFTANQNAYLVFEKGPSQTVVLQWATYYDAADQAGQSRRWGGIHPAEDDYPARVIGSTCGKNAWALARKYFDGSINSETPVPALAFGAGGSVTITCPARRGFYYQLEFSTDLVNWTAIGLSERTSETAVTYNHTPPSLPGFYRVRGLPSAP